MPEKTRLFFILESVQGGKAQEAQKAQFGPEKQKKPMFLLLLCLGPWGPDRGLGPRGPKGPSLGLFQNKKKSRKIKALFEFALGRYWVDVG